MKMGIKRTHARDKPPRQTRHASLIAPPSHPLSQVGPGQGWET